MVKKLFLCFSVCLLMSSLATRVVASDAPGKKLAVTEKSVQQYIKQTYQSIDFCGSDSISYEAFDKAMHGYLNLRAAGKLNTDKQILTICDFSKSANKYRLWIFDLDKGEVLFHTYVAHGQGSGEEFACKFSNKNNSHQTSLGFYVTGEIYNGEHGMSLRLNGLDAGFNSAALDRGIVVHGADYVSNNFIQGNERLGRSWGCPAVPSEFSSAIINTIKDSTCLFIYYPEKKYLAKSTWLQKKVELLPSEITPRFETMALKTSTAKLLPPPKVEVISMDSFRKSSQYFIKIEKMN